MDQTSIPIKNYFDLLEDGRIDNKTDCPICISGISDIITELYWDLKKNIKEGEFQRIMRKRFSMHIFHWKNNIYPIPIKRVKELLLLWKEICKKTLEEYDNTYERIYRQATYFKAKCSPVNIKVVRSIDADLAYLLGIIFADGSLRNIWLTFKKEERFRWEITTTDESSKNLETITPLLRNIFGIKTNVKTVYNGKWFRILFQSMILFRILNMVFEMPMGYKKGKLRIPKIIQEAPFEIKKHFVSGFFDGDGWCNKVDKQKYPIVAVSQSTERLLIELREILKEGGLNFNKYRKTKDQFVYYSLETKDKKQIIKFQKEFGFRYPNKKERLKKLVESFNN